MKTDRVDVYGPLYDLVSKYPCALRGKGPSCYGVSGAHHVKSVGSGGKDFANLVPVCMVHHGLLHGHKYNVTARDFCKEHDVNLQELAARYTAKALGESEDDLDY